MLRSALLALVAVSTAYHLASLLCAWSFARFRRRALAGPRAADAGLPPVSLLKPLRGVVPETEGNLASCLALDYPGLQVVFGVADPGDPVVEVVNRLRREHPGVDVELVVSDRRIGANAKVSNLDNMLRVARHDVIAIADADVRYEPDTLRLVVPGLDEPGAGLVTCAYRAAQSGSLPRRIEALFVNTDFAPMVAVARLVEKRSYAFGATIAIRLETLREIGGFRAIADHLADDYQLGQRVVALGKASVLSPAVVETVLDLDRFRDVVDHQLRWARTYRVCRPASYFATVATHATTWAVLYLVSSGFSPRALTVFAGAVGIRCAVGAAIARFAFGVRGILRDLWLVPAKDLFLSAIWALAFAGDTVRWGGAAFASDRDGRTRPPRPKSDTGASAAAADLGVASAMADRKSAAAAVAPATSHR
ncbi:MAG: bacteriohopanetetrol glucosamine biosynthesis glycosyltransferase HpnI [Alphaproteobacteria bacterium]